MGWWKDLIDGADAKWRAEHGYDPTLENIIRHGAARGRKAARENRGIREAMNMDGKHTAEGVEMTAQQVRDRRDFVARVLKELEGFESLEDAQLRLSEEYTVLAQADANAGRDDRGWDLWTEREDDSGQ